MDAGERKQFFHLRLSAFIGGSSLLLIAIVYSVVLVVVSFLQIAIV